MAGGKNGGGGGESALRTRARELAAGGTPCRCQRLVGPDVVQTRIYSESQTPHTHKHTNARARTHTQPCTHAHTHTHTQPAAAFVRVCARTCAGKGRSAAGARETGGTVQARVRANATKSPTDAELALALANYALRPPHRPSSHLLPCPLLSSPCASLFL